MPVGQPLFDFAGTQDLGPVDRQGAANLERIRVKYEKLGPLLQQLPGELAQSVVTVDADRVARGAPPLTDRQTATALKSALDGKPYTPPAERGYGVQSMPGNVLNDLGTIVKSIPRIPQALLGEARDIANIGEAIAENQAAGMNSLAALLNAPGVRMLPGAYIAGQATQGFEGLKELGRHPLFTLLDVLPIADKAAEATRVGQAAKQAELAAGRAPGGAALKALATKTVDDAGQLAPNRLSRGMATVRDSTRVGQTIDEAFGGRARWVARQRDQITAQMQAVLGDMQAPADQVEAAARDSVKLAADYADWEPAKMAELTQRLRTGDYADLGVDELAFVNRVRDLNARYAGHLVDSGEAIRVNGEVYDRATGARLQRRIAARDRVAELNFARAQVLTPTLDPVDYLQAARRWSDSDLPRAERHLRVRAALEALDGQGFDVANLRRRLEATRRGGTWDDLRTVLDTQLDSVRRGGELPRLSDKQMQSGIRTARRNRFAATMDEFDDKALARAGRKTDKALADAAPARFQPLIQQEAERRLIAERTPPAATADEAEALAQAVVEKRWQDVPGWDEQAEKAYRGIQREVRRTWMDMRAAGIDPEFVHTVAPQRIGQAINPTVAETRPGLTQSKARTMDAAPGAQDVTVALTHQGVEFLRRRATEDFVDVVARKYGVSEAELRESYLPGARARAQSQPILDVEGHLSRAISREWTKFDPLASASWGSPKLEALGQQQLWLPKSVANSLKKAHDTRSTMSAVLDPITNTYRMAVIGLSPRTQLYNILGNATMTLGRTGPSIVKYAEQAWEMARNPQLVDNIELRTLMGAQSRELRNLGDRVRLGTATKASDGALAYLGGRTVRRLWDQAQQAKATAAPVTGAVGGLVAKSLDFNAFVDNFYRASVYLYGEGKALGRGVSKTTAEQAGIELARKTLADWSAMTPFERSVMRSIIPFYGFTQTALRYVATYPLDHPLRAEIIGKLGAAELDDLNDTLPTKFLGTLFLGGQDNGKRVGLTGAAINPFGDVANMLTLAGFLGATNPVIQTVLESVGVDFGTAELYPTLRYDPETGRMAGVHPDPITALVGNVIPQTSILTSLLGANAEFRERMRVDPSGAWRQLAGAGGIPIVWKTYDLGAERMKTELNRQQSQRDVLTAALKSGDWAEAVRYPDLATAYQQLQQLPAEALPRFEKPEQVRTLASTTGGI